MSNKYPVTIGIRSNHKMKHYTDEAEIHKRELLKLGLEVYYDRNPHLKIKAKKKWIQNNLVNLKEEELSTHDEINNLERDLFNLTLSTQKVNEFFKNNNINNEEEFLKSAFEIKKCMGEDGTIMDVPNSDFGLQSLCCKMETDDFKIKVSEFFKLYAEVES